MKSMVWLPQRQDDEDYAKKLVETLDQMSVVPMMHCPDSSQGSPFSEVQSRLHVLCRMLRMRELYNLILQAATRS